MRQIDLNNDWSIVLDAPYTNSAGQECIVSEALLHHRTCDKPLNFGKSTFIGYIIKYHNNPHPFFLCCKKKLTKKLFNKIKFIANGLR